jgi:hypothetical protein
MLHRYPTRYQSKRAQHLPVPDESKKSEEEVRQESLHHYQHHQETLFASLIPYELQKEVESILLADDDGTIVLTDLEKKEAEQLYRMIDDLMAERCTTKLMTLHYPIICRLHATIELFTYMKYNHELVRRFHHLATIFHHYYEHFSALHTTIWNQCINPSSTNYKDIYLPYCTLLSTVKDIIHTGELIFIQEGLLRYS